MDIYNASTIQVLLNFYVCYFWDITILLNNLVSLLLCCPTKEKARLRSLPAQVQLLETSVSAVIKKIMRVNIILSIFCIKVMLTAFRPTMEKRVGCSIFRMQSDSMIHPWLLYQEHFT